MLGAETKATPRKDWGEEKKIKYGACWLPVGMVYSTIYLMSRQHVVTTLT